MKPAARARRREDAAVFLAALFARVGYWLWLGRPASLVGDALEYHEFARHLVEAGAYLGPQGELATRMPGYPLFLAALRLIFGGSQTPVILAQCALGAATCVLLLRLARRLLPEPWPLVCGGAAAGYFGLVAPCAFPLSESLYGFFLVLSVLSLYRAESSPARRAAAFGLLSGCLYLIRPEPLPYILATSLLLPVLFPAFGRRETALALAGAALVAGLWVGRNALVLRRLVPASTVGQNVKYLSLLLPAEQMGLAPEGRYVAPASLGELEREKDMARAYRELAGRLSWPQIVRAYLFNLASILYPFLPAYDWTYVTVLPFFLFGLRRAAARKELWPMAGAVACSLSVFIFFGGPASRYRQGISPFIVLLAAVGLKDAAALAGAARARVLGGAWAGANLLIFVYGAQAREAALQLKALLWRH